jgi:polyhydroxyalkanoate synthesis regulator phasin
VGAGATAQHREIAAMKQKIAALEDQVDELNVNVEALALDKEQLAIELEMAGEMAAATAALTTVSPSVVGSDPSDSDAKENSRLREALGKLQSVYKEEVGRLKGELDAIEAKLVSQQEDLDSAAALRRDYSSLSAQVEDLTEALEANNTGDLEAMVESLSLQNGEYSSQVKQLEATLADLEASQELDAEIEAAQKLEIDTLLGQENMALRSLKSAESRISKLEIELADAQRSNEQYRLLVDENKAEVTELTIRLASSRLQQDSGSGSIPQRVADAAASMSWPGLIERVTPDCRLLEFQQRFVALSMQESLSALRWLNSAIPRQDVETLNRLLMLIEAKTLLVRMTEKSINVSKEVLGDLLVEPQAIDFRSDRTSFYSLCDSGVFLLRCVGLGLKHIVCASKVVVSGEDVSEGLFLFSSTDSLRALDSILDSTYGELHSFTRLAQGDNLFFSPSRLVNLANVQESSLPDKSAKLLATLQRAVVNEEASRQFLLDVAWIDRLEDLNVIHLTLMSFLRAISFMSFSSQMRALELCVVSAEPGSALQSALETVQLAWVVLRDVRKFIEYESSAKNGEPRGFIRRN